MYVPAQRRMLTLGFCIPPWPIVWSRCHDLSRPTPALMGDELLCSFLGLIATGHYRKITTLQLLWAELDRAFQPAAVRVSTLPFLTFKGAIS